MSNFDDFRKRQEITRVADNTKMGVVITLILSLVLLTAIGEENAKEIIWYWAGFMTLLLIICAIQDIINHKRIKKL